MNSLYVLRGAVISAGLAFGIVALAPSAYAQYWGPGYWNGAPNAALPAAAPATAPAYSPPPAAPGPYGWGPNYGGWAPGYGGNNAAAVPQPYWHGAPEAIGPAS